jgi:hypothetical protein
MKKKKDAPFEKQKGCGTPLSLPDGKISEWYTPDVGKVSRNSQGESVAHPPFTELGHGHCQNNTTAIEVDRQNGTQVTVRCEPTVEIDLDCNPDSAKKPYVSRVSTKVGPPL